MSEEAKVKRYMPYDMAHDPVTRRSTFQAIEHPDGLYVLASDYDALARQLEEARAGRILTDKELVSAVITAVMSGEQTKRDDAVRKLQRHILRVEEERNQREAECERWAKGNADLARIIATSGGLNE